MSDTDFELEVARTLCPVGSLVYDDEVSFRTLEPVVRSTFCGRLVVWAESATPYPGQRFRYLDFDLDLFREPHASVL